MSVEELVPNVNVTESSKLDSRSILVLKTILPDDLVDCRQLQEGGTLPNIDGYLDLLCSDGTAREKVVVQIKHLTYPVQEGKVFYDIPQSIYAYAERHKGEQVLFIACDDVNKTFYWKNIDTASIEVFKNKSNHIQRTARYYFDDKEKCDEGNVVETIENWRELYKQKMESIRDERTLAEQFASQQRACFNSISSKLHGVKDSHIIRHQVNDIMQWLSKDSGETGENICLLVGDAGVGKSAVLKELISSCQNNDVRCLCIKADYIDDKGNPVTFEQIWNTLLYYSAGAGKVVLIVDQIDALSQSLTSDRKHLNMMMTILSSLKDFPNIKTVVSCRKYDLEYDSVLNRLKDESTLVEIGELTDDEVTTALNKLDDGLGKKIDLITAKILKTVQMLDAFCILYQRDKSIIKFNSRIELYDALWNNIICDSSIQDDVNVREQLMYEIAKYIRITGTLNPQFAPMSNQRRAFEYLASNRLIKREGSSVSFFHQSFYEYTLARHYSEKNSLFTSDIKKDIQGLEVRSTVKAVLDFKRGHDITKFVEEAQCVLVDPGIRLHLKLLTLSVIAFVETPSRSEKNLILGVCKADERLLDYFLRGVNSQKWFPTIQKLLNKMMLGLNRKNQLFSPIISCLSRYTFGNTNEVYGLIDNIQDKKSRQFAVTYLLRGHNDYSNPYVLKAYDEVKPQNTFYLIKLIQDAIKSNKEFALKEAEELILNYLIPNGIEKKHDSYELVNVLCTKLCSDYPTEMLEMLHRCFCKTVRETAVMELYGHTTTKILNGWSFDDNIKKLLELFERLLITYASKESLIRPLVEEFLILNNETTLSLAFVTMAESPKIYDDLIRTLLSSNRKIEENLHGDIEFFFLKLLKVWYNTIDKDDTVWYQKLLLSYKSELDFKFDAERKWSKFLCPHLWRDKWELICNTLPENSLIPEMKKCFQELLRRFDERIIIERPDHSVSAAFSCVGVVSNDIYVKWPVSNWLRSFQKLNENKWREGRNPISLREHADAFKKCVISNSDKFYNFVLDMYSRTDIRELYKVAGLEGLLAGGVNPYTLWDWAKQYITKDFAIRDSHTFNRITGYYIKEENPYLDEIIELCKSLTIVPVSEHNDTLTNEDIKLDASSRANNLLTEAINSFQGNAAELLVQICAIQTRRPMVYGFFTDSSGILPECIKAIPLHYLNARDYFDEDLYFPMIKSLLAGMGVEALYIQANVIQWCFYHKYDTVEGYINRIEADPSSHKLLVQIYFYGAVGTNNYIECENRLEKILSFNDEEIVATIVKTAIESYEHTKYRELCVRYLERFAVDDREKITNTYCLYCDSLPVEAFPWFYNIAKTWGKKKYQEKHNQLEYVNKCISTYPVICYKFIASQTLLNTEDNWIADDDIVKVLLEIYKNLSHDEDTDAMNEVLDLLEEYIYRDNRTIREALSLLYKEDIAL